MKKQVAKSPAFDYKKSAETRKRKRDEKDAVGLELGWTRKQAIRAKCLECMNNQRNEVRDCGCVDCALWPFRSRRPVSPKEMKAWEEAFRNSRDGRFFLKEETQETDDVDGTDGDDTPAADVIPDMDW